MNQTIDEPQIKFQLSQPTNICEEVINVVVRVEGKDDDDDDNEHMIVVIGKDKTIRLFSKDFELKTKVSNDTEILDAFFHKKTKCLITTGCFGRVFSWTLPDLKKKDGVGIVNMEVQIVLCSCNLKNITALDEDHIVCSTWYPNAPSQYGELFKVNCTDLEKFGSIHRFRQPVQDICKIQSIVNPPTIICASVSQGGDDRPLYSFDTTKKKDIEETKKFGVEGFDIATCVSTFMKKEKEYIISGGVAAIYIFDLEKGTVVQSIEKFPSISYSLCCNYSSSDNKSRYVLVGGRKVELVVKGHSSSSQEEEEEEEKEEEEIDEDYLWFFQCKRDEVNYELKNLKETLKRTWEIIESSELEFEGEEHHLERERKKLAMDTLKYRLLKKKESVKKNDYLKNIHKRQPGDIQILDQEEKRGQWFHVDGVHNFQWLSDQIPKYDNNNMKEEWAKALEMASQAIEKISRKYKGSVIQRHIEVYAEYRTEEVLIDDDPNNEEDDSEEREFERYPFGHRKFGMGFEVPPYWDFERECREEHEEVLNKMIEEKKQMEVYLQENKDNIEQRIKEEIEKRLSQFDEGMKEVKEKFQKQLEEAKQKNEALKKRNEENEKKKKESMKGKLKKSKKKRFHDFTLQIEEEKKREIQRVEWRVFEKAQRLYLKETNPELFVQLESHNSDIEKDYNEFREACSELVNKIGLYNNDQQQQQKDDEKDPEVLKKWEEKKKEAETMILEEIEKRYEEPLEDARKKNERLQKGGFVGHAYDKSKYEKIILEEAMQNLTKIVSQLYDKKNQQIEGSLFIIDTESFKFFPVPSVAFLTQKEEEDQPEDEKLLMMEGQVTNLVMMKKDEVVVSFGGNVSVFTIVSEK